MQSSFLLRPGALLSASGVLEILSALEGFSLAFTLAGAQQLRMFWREDIFLKKSDPVRR